MAGPRACGTRLVISLTVSVIRITLHSSMKRNTVASPAAPRSGRPRDPRIDDAVFAATISLLDKVGYSATTLEQIARQSGVSRPSVYRRWNSKAELVVDALAKMVGTDPAPDSGSLRGDLLALQSAMAGIYNTDLARRVVPALLGELWLQPELAERFRSTYIEPRRSSARRALERAVARGELDSIADLDLACDLLAGPLFLEAFILDRVIATDYVERNVDAVLAWLGLRSPLSNQTRRKERVRLRQ